MTTKLITDLYPDTTEHYIGKGTFAFAISVVDIDEVVVESFDQYLKINLYTQNISSNYNYQYTPINLVKCDDKFPISFQKMYKKNNQAKSNNISNYYCPENKDYFIESNYNSLKYHSIMLFATPCDSSLEDNCKSDEEIKDFINSHLIDLKIVYSYFDFEDFKNPVKTYLGDVDTFSLIPDICKSVRYPIKYNQAITDDNIFFGGGFFDITSYFYSVGKSHIQTENYNHCDSSLFMLEFYLDQESDIYQRSVFTLFDLLGLVGGIYTIFSILSSYIMNFITERLLMFSIFSNMYMVECNKNQVNLDLVNNEHNSKAKEGRIVPKSKLKSLISSDINIQNFDEKEEVKSYLSLNPNICEDSKYIEKYNQKSKVHENEHIEALSQILPPNQSDVAKSIIKNLNSKRRLRYSPTESIIGLCLCKMKYKNCKSLNRISETNSSYEIALSRFSKEADCVSILKSIRDLKILVESTLTENQRILLEFSKSGTINKTELMNKFEVYSKDNHQLI